MDITAGLIAKAGAGAAAVAATTTGVVFKDEISDLLGFGETNLWTEDILLEKTGLNCKNNQVCTLVSDKKIKIKQGDTTSDEISDLSSSTGKLKLHKEVEGYNQNLKFTVENGDISLTSGSKTTKLERDETYEVAQEEGKWLLVRKSTAIDAINEKLKNLGLPEGCRLDANGENGDPKDCGNLDANDLGEIKFEGFKEDFEVSIDGAQNVGLKISKNSNNDKNVFPDGIKIIFENTGEITLSGGGAASPVSWKKGTNPEFKINSSGKLEGAWTVNKLAEKVGLTCPVSSDSNECSFDVNTPIKIYEGVSKKTTTAKVSDTSRKLEFFLNEENHNQGVKFTVKGSGDINLGSGSGVASLVKDNASYEIKYQTDEWYLSKKTTTAP